MRALSSNPNIDNSDLANYPNGRIKDNTGSGNGTGVNENVYGDLHQLIAKLMRLYNIIPNGLPDNETNGFQLLDSFKSLATKNDYIYTLTTDGTILSIDIKLAYMNTNEYIVCLAGSDKTIETQIKGIGAGTFSVIYSGSFKANEYVRVVKTAIGVTIIRVSDWNSLNAMVGELNFLKAATYSDEITGTSNLVATNPLSNILAFVERVNGATSAGSLATALRNGLYPKEHFAIVAGIGVSPVKNYGTISLDVAGISGTIPASGDFGISATMVTSGSDSFVTVTMANAMNMTNGYYVRAFVQGQSTDLNNDNDICCPVFKPLTSTTFMIAFREITSNIQQLKVHMEVVQL